MTSPVPSSGDAGLVERLRQQALNIDSDMGFDDEANLFRQAADLIESLTQQQEQVEVRAWEYDTGDEWDLTADEAKAARLSEIIPVQPLIRLTDHQAIVARLTKERDEAREALRPFAEYLDECPFDLDNHGKPLPDDTGPGWTYLTAGDFRRARATLNGGAK